MIKLSDKWEIRHRGDFGFLDLFCIEHNCFFNNPDCKHATLKETVSASFNMVLPKEIFKKAVFLGVWAKP